MSHQQRRTIALPLAMIIGAVFHGFFNKLSFLPPYLIFAMLFVTYCRISSNEVRFSTFHWVLLAAQMILGTTIYAVLYSIDPLLAQGGMMCSFVPTAMAATTIGGMLGANGVVGAGYNLAMGAALAAKLRGSKQIAVAFFGDGASNRGTFHESCNMASVWKLPVLYVCEMNQWASTTPYLTATSVKDISVRAVGYDMPGKSVNGNDFFAVYEAAKEAVEYVRSGKGPYLLELKTYRIKGHFVGDPELYRTKEEVNEHFTEDDPIQNFRKTVLEKGWLTEAEMDKMDEDAKNLVLEAVKEADAAPYPAPEELMANYYID